jgi:hypothetical protein
MVNNRSNNPGHAGSARAGSQQQAAGQQGGATGARGVTLTPAEIRRIFKQREKNQRRREKRREGRSQVVEVMNQDGGRGKLSRSITTMGRTMFRRRDLMAHYRRIRITSRRQKGFRMHPVFGIPQPNESKKSRRRAKRNLHRNRTPIKVNKGALRP